MRNMSKVLSHLVMMKFKREKGEEIAVQVLETCSKEKKTGQKTY